MLVNRSFRASALENSTPARRAILRTSAGQRGRWRAGPLPGSLQGVMSPLSTPQQRLPVALDQGYRASVKKGELLAEIAGPVDQQLVQAQAARTQTRQRRFGQEHGGSLAKPARTGCRHAKD